MITPRGLCKEERLCNRTVVASLFSGGNSFLAYPFKVFYTLHPEEESMLRMMVSVGKKYNKRAVARNLIKRRTREAFRLNKSLFYEGRERGAANLCFVYIGKVEENYNCIENGIRKAIRKTVELLQTGDDLSL